MSECLSIRKNKVNIISWGRSSFEFRVMSYLSPFDQWKPFDTTKFDRGIEELREKLIEVEEQLESRKEILNHLNYEDSCTWLAYTQELKDEYKAIQEAIKNLKTIKEVCEEPVYGDDWEHEVPINLEWCRG